MPLHSRLSLEPSTDPCERFSLLGTYSPSPIQPIGYVPFISPCEAPLALPRPTAAGYSSRSNPGLVAMSANSRSCRFSLPLRLTTMTLGHLLTTALRTFARMFGYLDLLNVRGCTLLGRLQGAGLAREDDDGAAGGRGAATGGGGGTAAGGAGATGGGGGGATGGGGGGAALPVEQGHGSDSQ